MSMTRTEEKLICPQCDLVCWLHPEDMADPLYYAHKHRAILERARVLRLEKHIVHLPQWIRSFETKAWKAFKVDQGGEA